MNENWTRYWGFYAWISDPDLGELEIPEPPLSHQVEQDELDLFFMESNVHTGNEAADETEHSQDTSPTGPSLIGAWCGTYEYQRGQQSEGLVSLSITEHDDGKFGGSGIDGVGAFTVEGTIVGNKAIFTKSYTASDTTWKYVGVLDTEMAKIVGRWGPVDMEDDVPPLSAVEGSGPFNPPGEGAVDGDDGVSEAGSAISSVQTEAAEVLVIRGTFSLVRRPVDYFLYRPSDAEFQESRPKALWKMVRNAARHWYRSRHLAWDTLSERRDRRIRYTALLTKREEQGSLYDSDEAAEWAAIIQQTHPNDLRMWRAIGHFKEKRAYSHAYVHLISYLLLSH